MRIGCLCRGMPLPSLPSAMNVLPRHPTTTHLGPSLTGMLLVVLGGLCGALSPLGAWALLVAGGLRLAGLHKPGLAAAAYVGLATDGLLLFIAPKIKTYIPLLPMEWLLLALWWSVWEGPLPLPASWRRTLRLGFWWVLGVCAPPCW